MRDALIWAVDLIQLSLYVSDMLSPTPRAEIRLSPSQSARLKVTKDVGMGNIIIIIHEEPGW